ncbi:MAG: hypothetical protein WBG94_06675, partial [Anaerolineales bacterium]
MNFAQRTMKNKKTFLILLGIILLLLLASGNPASRVKAQSTVNWSDPTNLSQSGSASEPVMVVDGEGVFHVLWLDEFAGLVYSSGDGIEWSDPLPVTLPSRDAVPYLIADTNGYIHAFWTDID